MDVLSAHVSFFFFPLKPSSLKSEIRARLHVTSPMLPDTTIHTVIVLIDSQNISELYVRGYINCGGKKNKSQTPTLIDSN